MKATPLALPEILLIEPRAYEDSRGLFFESFNTRPTPAARRTF